MKGPTAPQLVPERTFSDNETLLRALDADCISEARNMEFRVESPPRELFGIYDHYVLSTDEEESIDRVSRAGQISMSIPRARVQRCAQLIAARHAAGVGSSGSGVASR